MKILYIITRSDILGGASVHLLELINGFQNRNIEVHVAVGGDGVFYNALKKHCPFVYNISSLKRNITPFSDFKAYFNIKNLIRELQPDLVHVHSAKAGLLGRLASRSLDVPNVYTVHGWPFTDGVQAFSAQIYKKIERLMMHKSDAIITVSEFDRNLALNNRFERVEIITSVLNGVPRKDVTSNSLTTNVIKLVMVARFDQQKDQKTLIEALSLISNKNWQLEFIGGGVELENMKVLSKKFGLDKKINFSGVCDDVYERLAQSDLFLLITNWEGLPLTILEAMSLNLPIIATDVGGISETIIPGETGYLVSKDINQIAEKISFYIDKPEMLEIHGNRSGELYESCFTVERMLDATFSVYKKVIN